ncbi:MAG: class I SAM-dependent methyltransferase [Acidimicrobiales bacterium]|jgi:SAM-dependent methyltransferase
MAEASAQHETGSRSEPASRSGGRVAHFFYRFSYRHGTPRWDSLEVHREVKALVADRQPGRALDIGCGCGTDAIYLALLGWDVVGVDFVAEAIETARERAAAAGVTPRFVLGDVTQLRQIGIQAPFDLILDTGCYHSVPDQLRESYAREVTELAVPGADFYVAGFYGPPKTWRLMGASGVDAADLLRRFGKDFQMVDHEAAGDRGRMSRFIRYHLVRKQHATIT